MTLDKGWKQIGKIFPFRAKLRNINKHIIFYSYDNKNKYFNFCNKQAFGKYCVGHKEIKQFTCKGINCKNCNSYSYFTTVEYIYPLNTKIGKLLFNRNLNEQ